jgi:hypothetical protein
VEIDNPDYKLKPGMYTQAYVRLPVGKVTELPDADAQGGREIGAVDRIATDALAAAYLDVAAALAQDKTDDAALTKLKAEAQSFKERLPASHAANPASVIETIATMTGKPIAEQREQFKSLSVRAIEFLRANPPDKTVLFVAHCPMVKADWLQTTKEISNPYYGQQMARCGEVTGSIQSQPGGNDPRYAVGYFCPIFPDRLYEKPESCPLDKFPLKLARVERVLAVPAAAVVNTGKRKVVYRESAPGTFDMLEIQAGKRAGEFYPVVSGLKEGDRVATAGAFLVDAENRLNPAASAQFFGASGGPQSSQQDKH